jgi:hypothetical protein
MDLFEILTHAINYYIERGFESETTLNDWLQKIKIALINSLIPESVMLQKLNDALTKSYDRLVNRGGLISKDIEAYTIDRIKPQLRAELDRRILASANLIKLNRTAAINKTLQRFSGWATSIPIGGSNVVDKKDEKKLLRKDLSRVQFEERRVFIDQTHKLHAAINDIVAVDSGAIAAEWHSHWRQINYNYRKDHKERDEKIYIVRDSRLAESGYLKAINGYTDEITQPGQEVYCRCYYKYIFSPYKLPPEYLTKKAKIDLKID